MKNPLLHPHWYVFGLTLNSDTLVTMWIVMFILVVGTWLIMRKATSGVPGPLQNALEYVVDFISGFIQESVNPKAGAMMLDYLLTTLLFLVVANIIGAIPFVHSPVADANVPIGMAGLVFVLTHWHGFRSKGFGYLKHFAPSAPTLIRPVLVLMSLIELVANPVTLSMRIFGNIFAGELLSRVLDQLLPFGLGYIIGWLPQVAWLLFSLFVDAIQAYVFMALTLTYVGMAMSDEEEQGDEVIV